ncbi:hypothetical protein MXB_5654, partial [Myxobolus squamalis]
KFCCQRRVVKTSIGLSQENLAIPRFVHIPVHAWVDTLIYLSFQGTVGAKSNKHTPCLFPLGILNLKGIDSWGGSTQLTTELYRQYKRIFIYYYVNSS